ncbi:hypothetical protein SLEP1_g3663 [Rubroshorea leprosula]|uniref:Uncharacterized protein n=1 Tax=Rubroshorea leprosula TaxID=152421 RepID=A0AAV5HUY9_9ROSI|nr:hypothetical protein SLEP1_g3663 [Rubroshorea leprosula]
MGGVSELDMVFEDIVVHHWLVWRYICSNMFEEREIVLLVNWQGEH